MRHGRPYPLGKPVAKGFCSIVNFTDQFLELGVGLEQVYKENNQHDEAHRRRKEGTGTCGR